MILSAYRRLGHGLAILGRAWFVLGAMALAGCGGNGGLGTVFFADPETALTYEVELSGSPSDHVTLLAEQSLSAYRFQDKGAPSLAFLRRRGEADVPVMLKILRSEGYYTATVTAKAEQTGPESAVLRIAIEPGAAFILTDHAMVIAHAGEMAPPELTAEQFGSPVGHRAEGALIAAAESAVVAYLNRRGFPYAQFVERSGLADPEAGTLRVESHISAGPYFVLGDVTYDGLERIDPEYLDTYRPFDDGEEFDGRELDEFQRRLFSTELFTAATVRIPETPPDTSGGGSLPVTVTVEEGPRRRVEGGLRYDTDLGPTVRASFEHRTLGDSNERLLIQGEAGLVEQSFGVGVRIPQFRRRHGQDLYSDVTVTRTTDDAFDALTLTGFAGIERQLSKSWRAGLGALGEVSAIDDDGDESTAYLIGAPFFIAYDGSNDLLNPTKGQRFRIEATPFGGVEDRQPSEFLVLNASGSAYKRLDKERRYVVAARGRAATILSPELDVVPATRRLYSGGGASVRGFAENIIGPLDDDDDPVGGRSALEAGLEFRARLWGDVGGVVFAEAGSVSTEVFPDFAEGIQTAVGVGLRYYSPAGPIRLDVGFPVTRRDADDFFQFYFSIGQAF